MDDATAAWIAQNKKVCTCLAITRKTIDEAIAAGASTVAEVNRRTRAGSGHCKGRQCGPKIQAILDEKGPR